MDVEKASPGAAVCAISCSGRYGLQPRRVADGRNNLIEKHSKATVRTIAL